MAHNHTLKICALQISESKSHQMQLWCRKYYSWDMCRMTCTRNGKRHLNVSPPVSSSVCVHCALVDIRSLLSQLTVMLFLSQVSIMALPLGSAWHFRIAAVSNNQNLTSSKMCPELCQAHPTSRTLPEENMAMVVGTFPRSLIQLNQLESLVPSA